jgi:hypothetical protein
MHFVKPFGRPKSTACFFNILEKKITGGETASFAATFYLDIKALFVKVGARFPPMLLT